jgi:ferredoxin-NADP reductase
MLPYRAELEKEGASIAYTRSDTDTRTAGAPTAEELRPLLEGRQLGYVCGSARFASYAETLLLECGVPAGSIRVERFGPSG